MAFNPYVFILIWIGIMAVFAYSYGEKAYSPKLVYDHEIYQIKMAFVVATFIPIFLTVIFARPIGDVYLYLDSFHSVKPDYSSINWEAKGPGYQILVVTIKILFGDNEIAYRTIVALIQSIPVLIVLRYYSSHFMSTIFLFVASATYVGWMMNGLRQYVAVAIIYTLTPLMLKKKYLPCIIVILLASTIHNSALFMIPVIFIVQGKTWNGKTLLFMVLLIAVMIFFLRDDSAFEEFAVSIGYGAKDNVNDKYTGTSILRVIVNIIPTVFAFIFRKKINKDDTLLSFYINMSVITAGVFLVSMVTSGVLVGRIPAYTSMYNMILLPYLIRECFEEDNRKFVNIAMIVLYLAYYYYQMHFVSGLI